MKPHQKKYEPHAPTPQQLVTHIHNLRDSYNTRQGVSPGLVAYFRGRVMHAPSQVDALLLIIALRGLGCTAHDAMTLLKLTGTRWPELWEVPDAAG